MSASASNNEIVTVAGKQISYHVFGQGPDLFLLHGSGPGVTGMENFEGNVAAFSQHFRVYVPDLPGYGKSDAVEGVQDMASAELMIGFMDALGVESAAIIGNSFGGYVGARMAAAHPERVSKLVTIGGIGYGIFAPFPNEGINLLSEFAEDPTRARMEQWLRSMVYDKALITDELVDRRYKQAMEPKTLETTRIMYARAQMAAMGKMLESAIALKGLEFLTQITCPMLMCWGRDDRVSALDRALVPMRLIQNCELHVFPKCGHWAMIERKAEFEQTALGFLRR
ncbi:MAG: alpha/beta fold hydrolase [Hyphomonadaceae bacterium]|nr:alpha/beta fold hydrolase [Hyphomonadaceae bacterium]